MDTLDIAQILNLAEKNSGMIRFEVKAEDLQKFANTLVHKTIDEMQQASLTAPKEERLLTREEVKSLCGVCDTTLWTWGKMNYLTPIKIGAKVRYRESDVKKVMGLAKTK